jgi:hypothetical protein
MQFVIPDLVSEERAESVGNPCLIAEDSEAARIGCGKIQPSLRDSDLGVN